MNKNDSEFSLELGNKSDFYKIAQGNFFFSFWSNKKVENWPRQRIWFHQRKFTRRNAKVWTIIFNNSRGTIS